MMFTPGDRRVRRRQDPHAVRRRRGSVPCVAGLWLRGHGPPAHRGAGRRVARGGAWSRGRAGRELRELAPIVKGGSIVVVVRPRGRSSSCGPSDSCSIRDRHQQGLSSTLTGRPGPHSKGGSEFAPSIVDSPARVPGRGRHGAVPPVHLRGPQLQSRPGGAGGDRAACVLCLLRFRWVIGGAAVAPTAAVRRVLPRLRRAVHRRVLELRELRPAGPRARPALSVVPGAVLDPARRSSSARPAAPVRDARSTAVGVVSDRSARSGRRRHRGVAPRCSTSARRSSAAPEGRRRRGRVVALLLAVGGARSSLGRLVGRRPSGVGPGGGRDRGGGRRRAHVGGGRTAGRSSGPFGYRNATGAFYVQAAIAALMVAACGAAVAAPGAGDRRRGPVRDRRREGFVGRRG